VIKRLCFSDVAVSSQRRWREVEFEALSISSSDGRSAVGLHFPLWGIPHPTLLSDLIADRVRAQVINVTKSTAASETAGFLPGADFNSRLFEAAQSLGWSPIGERGEFSTHIQLIL
jgi:diphthamide synthase (EF-2-diphthine--ammonia ligase)